MRRLLSVLFLFGLCTVAGSQEPAPKKQTEPALGGSTEKATLTLNPHGHIGAIRGVFFTPDGKQLVSVGYDKTVQFWDVAGGERLKVLRLPFAPLRAGVLSPDGKTLALCPPATGKGRRVFLLNIQDGRVRWLGGRDTPGCFEVLAFSPDGNQLAGSHHGPGNVVVMLWEGLQGAWEKTPEDLAALKPRLITPERTRDLYDFHESGVFARRQAPGPGPAHQRGRGAQDGLPARRAGPWGKAHAAAAAAHLQHDHRHRLEPGRSGGGDGRSK